MGSDNLKLSVTMGLIRSRFIVNWKTTDRIASEEFQICIFHHVFFFFFFFSTKWGFSSITSMDFDTFDLDDTPICKKYIYQFNPRLSCSTTRLSFRSHMHLSSFSLYRLMDWLIVTESNQWSSSCSCRFVVMYWKAFEKNKNVIVLQTSH